jgi:hypothetical protein
MSTGKKKIRPPQLDPPLDSPLDLPLDRPMVGEDGGRREIDTLVNEWAHPSTLFKGSYHIEQNLFHIVYFRHKDIRVDYR